MPRNDFETQGFFVESAEPRWFRVFERAFGVIAIAGSAFILIEVFLWALRGFRVVGL